MSDPDREARIEAFLDDCRSRLSGVALAMPELEELARRKGISRRETLAPPKSRKAPAVVPTTREAPPSPRGRLLPIVAVMSALLAGGLLSFERWRARGGPEVRRTVALEQGALERLGAAPGALYSVDPQKRLLLTLSEAGQTTAIHRLPEELPDGLAAGSGGVWMSDALSGRILRCAVGQGLRVEKSYANPHISPGALHWDGRSLWVYDERTKTVSRYGVGETLSLAGQYTLPGPVPAALHVSDGLLWTLDATRRAVVRYRMGALLVAQDELDLGRWLPGAGRLTGMAVEGGRLWVVAQAPDELHRLDLSRLGAKGAWSASAALGLDLDHGSTSR